MTRICALRETMIGSCLWVESQRLQDAVKGDVSQLGRAHLFLAQSFHLDFRRDDLRAEFFGLPFDARNRLHGIA